MVQHKYIAIGKIYDLKCRSMDQIVLYSMIMLLSCSIFLPGETIFFPCVCISDLSTFTVHVFMLIVII